MLNLVQLISKCSLSLTLIYCKSMNFSQNCLKIYPRFYLAFKSWSTHSRNRHNIFWPWQKDKSVVIVNKTLWSKVILDWQVSKCEQCLLLSLEHSSLGKYHCTAGLQFGLIRQIYNIQMLTYFLFGRIQCSQTDDCCIVILTLTKQVNVLSHHLSFPN